MATVSYSWWWDSHNTPKNSKWLQENLTDMDAKVQAMIKLIEEDADSFARRAEMYYKKRPELMKLVEEFYRAYRALAERYNHATVELHQAHRTMAKAFPSQVPYDSPSSSSCPETKSHTPDMRYHSCSPFDHNDLHKDAFGLSITNFHALIRNSKMGLKQLLDMFGSGGVTCNSNLPECKDLSFPLSGQNLKTEALSESHQRALEAEAEVQTLKKTIAEILAEKEAMYLQFQQNLEKLSDLERRCNHAQDYAEGFDEEESRAEIEIKVLKEDLARLEAQKDIVHFQHDECTGRIFSLQAMLSVSQEDAEGFKERACIAEGKAQNLREELSKMEAEKEAGLFQYDQCLEKIFALENKISLTEEDAWLLKEQTNIAKVEVKELKEALVKLNEEKDATAVECKRCLESIAKMESELLQAKEDAERLRSEVLMGAAKLKSAEERSVQLEISNHSLQSEYEHLAHDIAIKDLELSKKQDELEKLEVFAQDEHTRFMEIEANLQILQKLHSQSQDEQQALALLLENGLQMVKDLESNKHGLEQKIKQVTEESQTLNELNLSSKNTIQNLQSEISSLKGIREKLEEAFSLQAQASNVLHQEIYKLKEEIKHLSEKTQGLVAQMESVGIDPDSLLSSLKGLQEENLKLKETCKKDVDGREFLYKKSKDMDKLLTENDGLENSLLEVNDMLRGSREKVTELQESYQALQGAKSRLVSEKATLLSQLHIISENMQMLLEKNTLLETSLSNANIELEGLRVNSKNLEEFCQLHTDKKSNLLHERSILVSQLESVEQRLGNLESRFTKLEEKYAGLEIEKQNTSSQVEELHSCLNMEKQEHANYLQSNEVWLASLEDHVQLLQEESRLSKKEPEEQLDKAVKARVEIFILQKFINDLEEKSSSILIECQKHVEASKMSDEMITESETENLEQQVEVEFLLDEIEKLRMDIHHILMALHMVPNDRLENWVEQEQAPLSRILDSIEGLKSSLFSNNDDKQQLLIENSVLLTLLEQLKLEGSELVSEKTILGREFGIMTEQLANLEKGKHELLKMNMQLRLEFSKGEQNEADLKAEMESLCVKLVDLEGAYKLLQEQNFKVLTENRYLQKQISGLKLEMHVLEEENIDVLHEYVALSTTSLVFKSFGVEKVAELKALNEDLNRLQEIRELRQRLEINEEENICLNESAKMFKKELDDAEELNGTLNHQLSTVKDFLRLKEIELYDVVEKLAAAKKLNMDLFKAMEELKNECEKSNLVRESTEKQVLKLCEDNTNQYREIEQLREVKGNLESEMGKLTKQIEESRSRENKLSLELQERSNEFELWEAEAATFYFDTQVSSVHEVLLEDKIQELARVCGSLGEESDTKSREIGQMKERVSFLENELVGLKAELSAYAPAIASLRDGVTSLELNALHRTRPSLSSSQQQKDTQGLTIHSTEMSSKDIRVDQCAPKGISDLQKMHARIREVEKAVVEEMERLAVAAQESSGKNINLEGAVKETEDLKSDSTVILKEKSEVGPQLADKVKPEKSKPVLFGARNGILMKDIPLDHVADWSLYGTSRRRNRKSDDRMLELWETAEQDRALRPMVNVRPNGSLRHRHGEMKNLEGISPKFEKVLAVDKLEVLPCTSIDPNQERKKKILEKLASDAKKLVSLQATVVDMKRKMKTSKNNKHAECKTMEVHLQQAEEAIMELVGLNHQLAKTIQERPSRLNVKRLSEEARKGSEKIEPLQLEVQNIQHALLKLEDEKKRRFPVNKASVFLRIFLLTGNRTRGKRNKVRFCGCLRHTYN